MALPLVRKEPTVGMLLLGPKRIMDMADEVGCTSCLCKDIETKINILVTLGTSFTHA